MSNRTLCRNAMLSAAFTATIAALGPPAQARVSGKDGAFTATAANTVVNSYTTARDTTSPNSATTSPISITTPGGGS